MKLIICLLAVMPIITTAYAQEKIEWRKDKVTQIIFPYEIVKHRSGYTSDSALTQNDGRIMYVQPISEIGETNLNVITTDGSYYAFNLVYNANAPQVNYIVETSMAIFRDPKLAVLSPEVTDDTQVAGAAPSETQPRKETAGNTIFTKVKQQGDYITANNVARLQKLTVLLKAVFVDQKYVYFRFNIENSSNVPFDVDYIAFSVTGKTTKKTSTQERIQIIPLAVDHEIHRLNAKSSCEVIYAFEKFTIGKDKILLAEVLEQGGDRNIALRIPESFIIDARSL